MKIVKPQVIVDGPVRGKKILEDIEWVARTCYKSEEAICDGSAERLVRKLLSNDPPHLPMLDHVSMRVKFIVDRGVSHEIVRHRIGVAYAQESTRYCNYGKDKFGKEITVIEPPGMNPLGYAFWEQTTKAAEAAYLELLQDGAKPQIARAVLPTCLKTEIVVTATMTAWRHIFKMRTDRAAHPQMRQVMCPLLSWLQFRVPVLFEDISPFREEGLELAEVTEVIR